MLWIVRAPELRQHSQDGARWTRNVVQGLVSVGASGVRLVRIGEYSIPAEHIRALKLVGALGNFDVIDEVFLPEEGDPTVVLSNSGRNWTEGKIATLFFAESSFAELLEWVSSSLGGAAKFQFVSNDGTGITLPTSAG